MNERIKLLSKQAIEIVAKKRILPDGQIERTWRPEYYDQVFAELIVRECITLINSEKYRIHSPGWNDAIEWADGLIKEHFGVEE